MSGRAFGSPSRYIQQKGEFDRLGTHVAPLGSRALVLVDRVVEDKHGDRLKAALAGLDARFAVFGGECCAAEVDRVAALVGDASVVVGVGGGKTIDTAKLAAVAHEARMVAVPTIASTDAPCSAVAVRYTDAGVYDDALRLPRNPDAVVVDPLVVVAAPARFLVAGMGDALSTYFEARSNLEKRSPNLVGSGYAAPLAGIAIARSCHEILMRDGLAAKLAAERGACTAAVENIIEANTLLSGLGFENCNVSAAHGIHDGLTVLEAVHGFFHGEKVAFGTLCLLMLEGRPSSEIIEVARFCRSVGLPTTLADLNLGGATPAEIERVAAAALRPGTPTHNVPVELSVPLVRDAILALDAFTTALPALPTG